MKSRHRKYRLSVEDESRLGELFSWRFTRSRFILIAAGIFILFAAAIFAAVVYTPLRNLMPGSLKSGEREQTIRGLMRIDSLEEHYNLQEGYARNVLAILDPERAAGVADRQLPVNTRQPDAEALLEAGEEERAFIKMMDERERYNLSVLSPASSDGIYFTSVCPGSIVRESAPTDRRMTLILPKGKSVLADADGTITTCRFSSDDHGYEIHIHHPRGYMTQYFGLGTPLVRKGERVVAGQAISAGADREGVGSNIIGIEIWRDGEPQSPASLLENY